MSQKKVAWTWGTDQQKAFDQVESALTSDRALVHYDPSKTLILACDATPYVMSAVLSLNNDFIVHALASSSIFTLCNCVLGISIMSESKVWYLRVYW